MNFDLLPGSNVNRYTGKEFPCKWMLIELLLGGGGTSCLTNQILLLTPLKGLDIDANSVQNP